MRRTLSASVTFLLLICTTASLADEKKAVFDLRSGDADRIEVRLLGDIKYVWDRYKKQGDDFSAIVVISGRSYKYFIEDLENSPYRDEDGLAEANAKLRPMMEDLHENYGVKFQMCIVGMQDRGINAETLYPFVEADESQPVYMINHQMDGYAYLPIN